MSSNRRFRLKDGSIPRALTLPASEDRHKPFDHTQGSLQPRPQYEKHLRIDGGQSSFFFGISTGGYERKQDFQRAQVSTSLARIHQYQ